MRRFENIVVGVELTLDGHVAESSRVAARSAAWLARETGAALTLLHSTWADIYADGDVIRPGVGPEASRALEEFAASHTSDGVAAELVLVTGRAWVELIRRVQAGDSDFVVVGQQPGVGRPFGSNARKLMRKCPAPVWVVKPESEVAKRAILAATDLTPVGDTAVELAASFAVAHACALHVVHAWQTPMELQLSKESSSAIQAGLAELQATTEQRVRASLAALEFAGEPVLHVARDSPSRLIRRVVAEVGADLVVMGSLSRKGVAGLLMGSTAERMLERIDCSVVSIKPEGFVSPVGTGA